MIYNITSIKNIYIGTKMHIDIEFKNLDGEKGTFVAYGSTFENEDLGGDVMKKGAFEKSLQENPAENVYMFYNHDSKEIIGEYTEIKEDNHGLLIKGRLFIEDIKRAQETYFLMKKGLIKKFSIGYSIVKKSYEKGKRLLEEVKLIEVSPVTFPMNPEASIIGVKSMRDLDIRDFEKKLRDVGFSQKEAKLIASKGFKGLKERDVVEGEESKADEWAEVVKELKDYKL